MCKKKTFAERRAIINSIPEGLYCYDLVLNDGCKRDESDDIITWLNKRHQVNCPYWKHIGRQRAKCVLLKIKDRYEQDDDTLLWDQVKLCGIKRPKGL